MSISTRTTHQPPPQLHPQHHPQPPQPTHRYTLDLTILSAKHLKNVNWKNGDLKPYAIFWVDPDHKLTTKSDDSSNIKPIWNQRFSLPIPSSSLHDAVFTLEIFHSKASETPKPFVGSSVIPLFSLPEPDNPTLLRSFPLLRPSGRPQGVIKLKLSISQTLDFHNTPLPGYYYSSSSAPPYPYNLSRSASQVMPPPAAYPSSMGYYASAGAGYYQPPPRQGVAPVGYGAAPSAPVDYSPYDQQQRGLGGGRGGLGFGVGAGLAVGAVAGGIAGIALDEGLKHEEEKVEDNGYLVGSSSTAKDEFSEHRPDF